MRQLTKAALQAMKVPNRRQLSVTELDEKAKLTESIEAPYSISNASIEARLCKYCQKLVRDVLDGQMYPNCWTRYNYPKTPRKLMSLDTHHDNKFASLLASARNCCQLCSLIVDRYQNHRVLLDLQSEYCIFSWGTVAINYEFSVCLQTRELVAERVWYGGIDSLESFSLRYSIDNYENELHVLDVKGLSDKTGNEMPPLPTFGHEIEDLGSSKNFEQARMWYQECSSDHSDCQILETAQPRRLLDINSDAPGGPRVARLCENENGDPLKYATLSYAWGSSLPLRTTKLNLKDHCVEIQLETMPRTFRDAIKIAQTLDFSYLWIDTLCIVQDDEDDWAHQSARMCDIYQGSSLNISALSSTNCEEGILNTACHTELLLGSYLHPSSQRKLTIHVVSFPSRKGCFKFHASHRDHLTTRGWALQELIVSCATLHYTDRGLFWECASRFHSANERYKKLNSQNEKSD